MYLLIPMMKGHKLFCINIRSSISYWMKIYSLVVNVSLLIWWLQLLTSTQVIQLYEQFVNKQSITIYGSFSFLVVCIFPWILFFILVLVVFDFITFNNNKFIMSGKAVLTSILHEKIKNHFLHSKTTLLKKLGEQANVIKCEQTNK